MHTGVHNNIALMNANNRYKINTGKRAKSSEKLASGYRINRSADDAAGVTISEKMRAQIRALNQGTENAQDGISWVQVGDGALNEVHALLQRMRELTIQSLNDTNTELDRAACQAEFDALQSEVDRIAGTTQFNTQNIFDGHELPYYQCEGNMEWDQGQQHIIGSNNNELVITYREKENEASKEVRLQVPAGIYTTQELIDEIEDAAIAKGLNQEGIIVEYTQYGTCNLNLEGGEVIDGIGGGLSYLFYDMYEGGGFGALVGTTVFINDKVKLEIASPNNNYMEFTMEDFNGHSQVKQITIPDGKYNKQELIDILNRELQGTTVKAVEYGTGIKLEGSDCIVTGFKGNMFKIDEGGKIYHSVFYDNVNYGQVTLEPAVFTGGAVKPTSSNSEEYQKYVIDSSNNQLVLKPNGADTATTITLTEKEYTVAEMQDELNRLFAQENLQLRADAYSSDGYEGLKITSLVEGATSDVGIDSANSSAYETLFTKKVYNDIATVNPVKDGTTDKDAYVRGAKEITSSLTLTSTNNQFKLAVEKTNGSKSEVTLTLSEQTYQTASALANEIAAQINDSSLVVTAESGCIKIAGAPGSGVKSVTVDEVIGNKGYEDIFVKITVKETTQIKTGTEVELSGIPSGGFNSTNNKITITVGGKNHTVDLPTGTEDQTEIIKAIEDAIKQKETVSDIKFTNANGYGRTDDGNFTGLDNGASPYYSRDYSNTGSAKEVEGKPGYYENNTPAKVTMAYAVPSSIKIDDTCNKLRIRINDETKDITIANGTYNPSQLASKIQDAIDTAFGKQYGGATVTLDSNNKLVFTARLMYDGAEMSGKDTYISCNTAGSSLLKKIHTIDEAATIISNKPLLSNISITDDNNTFKFKLNSQEVSVNLPKGLYATPAAFVSELNKVFDNANLAVTASLENGKLRLTTDDKGSNTSLVYSSSDGGTSALTLFGDLITKTPASITLDKSIQEKITIDSTNNEFTLTINGQTKTVYLTPGTDYDRTSFVNMLNGHLNGTGVTAELVGNQLKLTTDATGNGTALSMTYGTGGSSMKPIFGENKTVEPGVDAEFINNKLVLRGTLDGTQISVSSDNNAFLEPKREIITTDPSKETGYYSTMYSKIDGYPLTEPVTIDEYSNNLSFNYVENGVSTAVSVEVPAGKSYTYDELRDILQAGIKTVLGDDKLEVSVSDEGVVIRATKPGNAYYMNGFLGDFYNKIICQCTKKTDKVSVDDNNGKQIGTLAYTVGRKNVRTGTTLIRSNVNDVLSLDLTYGTTTKKLSFKLDAGEYSGTSLVQQIQEKLNGALKAEGLSENLIEVSIGGVNTGVTGSNDKDALVFKLSDSVELPAEGEYIIDGVSGNAAFTVFYQTDGELEPAYITGTKDISNGVTIKNGETELSFKVDGTQYKINIDAGDYTADEIIEKMNNLLNAAGIPAVAENYDNNIRLSYPSLGKHTISDVKGGAKEEIFFQENGELGERKGIKIQMSGNASDHLEIERPLMNTSFLKINSIAITKPKYANKALGRLDYAINRVSEIRSHYGSMQNRLEHSVANNQNTSENTQAAESRIRDTDMASEVMENTKYAILQQATEAIMAHAKIQAQNIIKLLQG